jgi:uncharacterized protein (DUF1330 family)
MLIIEFETAEAARRWHASPEYQAAKAVRQGNSNLLLLVGAALGPLRPSRTCRLI